LVEFAEFVGWGKGARTGSSLPTVEIARIADVGDVASIARKIKARARDLPLAAMTLTGEG
jgi:hypothetical protein